MSTGSPGLPPLLAGLGEPCLPLQAARHWRGAEGLILLDHPAVQGQPATSYLAAFPEQILEGSVAEPDGGLGGALYRRSVEQGHEGGLFGWVDFEGRYRFGLYRGWYAYNHETGSWSTAGTPSHRFLDDSGFDLNRPEGGILAAPSPDEEGEIYLERVRRARQWIAAGDIYQINVSRPWSAPWTPGADAFLFHEMLARCSPAPWSAFLDLGGTQIAGSSPECFLAMDGTEILTRPIKGTRGRVPDSSHADHAAARELLASPKENAELLMITDLMRNDLGRLCQTGSVDTSELRVLESFAQVHHLVSTVKGSLQPGISHWDALVSAFPAGSISGAPKIRAVELIKELEGFDRGIYTGTIGFLGFGGLSRFNVAIRTAVIEDDRLRFHVGAGIVADSDPQFELEETHHKARGILKACEESLAGATELRPPRPDWKSNAEALPPF